MRQGKIGRNCKIQARNLVTRALKVNNKAIKKCNYHVIGNNLDVSCGIVWIDMLSEDSEKKATSSSAIFSDTHVTQFYDPDQLSRKAVAESLGWPGKTAWDIYLFYPAGSEWDQHPPHPVEWIHQLKADWADRKHFRTGSDLVDSLHRLAQKILNASQMDR